MQREKEKYIFPSQYSKFTSYTIFELLYSTSINNTTNVLSHKSELFLLKYKNVFL